jgi:hypothetical protein
MPEIPIKSDPEYKNNRKKYNKYIDKALKSQKKDAINITGKP